MVFVAGNLVPFQVLMIPVRDLVIALRLYDTRLALILFHIAFQTGFCTLFMRNFIRDLPDALLDAARMDGAGELRLFWYVVLPLVRPAIAAMSVLIFTFVWNDYFWSLVLVQSDSVRPDHRGTAIAARHVADLVASGLRRLDRRGDAAGGDLLPDAAASRGRTDIWNGADGMTFPPAPSISKCSACACRGQPDF